METVQRKKFTASSWLLLVLFAILAVLMLFPLYALFLASLKPASELFRYGLNVRLDFDVMSLDNYRSIFTGKGEAGHYFEWYSNSVIITVLFTLLSLLLSSMVGYGLGMYRFKGRNLIFTLVLIVMMIPVEIILLPLYKLTVSLKLINTVWGVILPFMVAPLPIFFFRQFALGLPKDFMDAGRIDGCTEFGIFFRIMVPLMAPAYGAITILQAMNSWNNFLWPLIVLRTTDKFTLPIGLASFVTPLGSNYEALIAGAVLAILPILILFLFFQRYFIEGLTVGGVKG
ncbi:L-arabinose transport system permease protein AraQ [Paenibacillus auburnensis]|jgi:arabinosaccharide transport system permease protein|uniref:L-arabinose transport system permease protein AraQ n=1 Tax=Paenibacillus auburnensis TaxID=2905649 RepID=A0ABM9CV48_9BACL|nr:carbohydrate ABC transporter permease [Paenibacillus auburnensis]CAH1223566.1 L-arabinose transport system permease protein AraQ [Paenibacillus auburnensis]